MVTFKDLRDDSTAPLDLSKEVERLRLQVHMAEMGAFVPADQAPNVSEAIASSFTSPEDFRVREDSIHYPNGDTYTGELLGPLRHGRGDHLCSSGDRYIGSWKYDKRDGKGRLVLASGVQYDGDWRDDKTNGTGTCVYEDGAVYSGDWEDDQRSGWGSHSFKSGARYEGEWSNDTMQGNGMMWFEDGSVFDGQWGAGQRLKGKHVAVDGSWEYSGEYKDDLQHGTGVFFRRGLFKYTGEWQEGQQHGQGKCQYADGGVYDGEWRQGKRHGKGVFAFQGYKYQGTWAEDAQCGPGQCVTESGDRYIGHFKNGAREGRGRCAYADGSQYEGDWVADKRQGQGICIYANGDKYKGEWKADRRHGQGTCRFADGTRFRGEWEDDGWVQSAACPAASRLAGPGLIRARVGETASFVVQARDEDGNRRLEGGDDFVAALYGPREVAVCQVEDAGDGSYAVRYEARVAGLCELHVTLGDEHVAASPYPVRVEPGAAVARASVVEGEGRQRATPGQPATFAVALRDAAGNRCAGAEALAAVPLAPELQGPRGQPVPVRVEPDELDACYRCSYVAEEPGLYRLHLLCRDVHLPGSPFSVAVGTAPAEPRAGKAAGGSLASADGAIENAAQADANNPPAAEPAPLDLTNLWESRARLAYAADGDDAGWDSDGEAAASSATGAPEDAYIKAHPDVPVVENLEDIWQVSKLQAERKKKEEKAKTDRLRQLQERLGSEFGAAQPPKPEEVQAALQEILEAERSAKQGCAAGAEGGKAAGAAAVSHGTQPAPVSRKEKLRAAAAALDALDDI